VIPFRLNDSLSSNGSNKGDQFSATMQGNGGGDYVGLPSGTTVEGHVSSVRRKTNKAPGVLGLAFDRIRLPNGNAFVVHGSVIGLDGKSVVNQNGRYVAKPGSKTSDLQFIGIGAGAGALVSIVTKGNFLVDTVIGGALGYGASRLQKSPSKFNNVTLKEGTKFGMRLNRSLSFHNPSPRSSSVGAH
jgi:hypothetical protein